MLRTGVDKKAEVMRKTGRSSKGIRGGGGASLLAAMVLPVPGGPRRGGGGGKTSAMRKARQHGRRYNWLDSQGSREVRSHPLYAASAALISTPSSGPDAASTCDRRAGGEHNQYERQGRPSQPMVHDAAWAGSENILVDIKH